MVTKHLSLIKVVSTATLLLLSMVVEASMSSIYISDLNTSGSHYDSEGMYISASSPSCYGIFSASSDYQTFFTHQEHMIVCPTPIHINALKWCNGYGPSYNCNEGLQKSDIENLNKFQNTDISLNKQMVITYYLDQQHKPRLLVSLIDN